MELRSLEKSVLSFFFLCVCIYIRNAAKYHISVDDIYHGNQCLSLDYSRVN